MKKSMAFILCLSLALMLAGCASPAETSSPPPDEENNSTQNPETASGRELVFDAEGNVIEDEDGHVDVGAAVENMDSFTLEEVIKLIPYSDGALATSVDVALSKLLVKDFDNVVSKLAASEDTLSAERLEIKQAVYHGIGNELAWAVEAGRLTKEDCKILYGDHEAMSQRENDIVHWIVAGYEQVPFEQVK